MPRGSSIAALSAMPGVRDKNDLPVPMKALVEAIIAQNLLQPNELVQKAQIDAAPAKMRPKAFSNLNYQLGKHFDNKSEEYDQCSTDEAQSEQRVKTYKSRSFDSYSVFLFRNDHTK